MADNMLPFDYQSEIDQQTRRRQLAEMMLKQSMQPIQMPQGRIASKISPLAIMAQVAGQTIGASNLADADAGIANAKQRYSTDERKAVQELLALPAEERITRGMASPFPRVSQIAGEEKKTADKRFDAALGFVGKDNPQIGVGMARSGAYPTQEIPEEQVTVGNYRVPKSQKGYVGPNMGAPGPIPGVPGVYGQKDADSNKYSLLNGAPSTNIDFKLPGREAEVGLDSVRNELKTRQGKADAAKGILSSNAFAADALQNGARAGGGQAQVQFLRKALQAFGLESADGASTEQLSMALGNAVLENAVKLRPASDTDIKILGGIVGQIATDPTALTKALAYSNAMSLRELKGYKDYGKEMLATLRSDYAKDLITAGTTGYDLPTNIAGPEGLQFETIRQFQNLGQDPSIFQIGGQNVGQGTQFNVNPLRGQNPKNSGNKAVKPRPDRPEGYDQLSPEDQAEYDRLKGLRK